MTKIKFTHEEDKILERLNNFEVEKQNGLIPRYAIYVRDDEWCLTCVYRQTRWGVNRYIEKILRKKAKYDRERGTQNGN